MMDVAIRIVPPDLMVHATQVSVVNMTQVTVMSHAVVRFCRSGGDRGDDCRRTQCQHNDEGRHSKLPAERNQLNHTHSSVTHPHHPVGQCAFVSKGAPGADIRAPYAIPAMATARRDAAMRTRVRGDFAMSP